MRRIGIEFVGCALAGWLLLSAAPARGQILSYVDETGKRIYINADPPAVRKTASKSATSAGRAATMSQPSDRRVVRKDWPGPEEIQRIADVVAERHHVDPALVRAVIEAESNWDPGAVSHKGAQGLMQLMPGTASDLGVGDAFDPQQNLEGGIRHLRSLLVKYNGDLDKALAAYNAGGGAVDRARGVPNIRETRNYVQKITDSYFSPGSGRRASVLSVPRGIYRTVDERGRVIFTNE